LGAVLGGLVDSVFGKTVAIAFVESAWAPHANE